MSVVHRASHVLLATLKDSPADATAVSHQLLVRAGFIRQLSAGLYHQLPLARRSLKRLEALLRAELDGIGGQEFRLPALHPAELWQASGRWAMVDDTLFRLRDRRGSDYCLAMTHEEAFTVLARAELRSYRQLPQLWYQLSLKFRDEPRPRAGLLRTREFHMQDAYSFDLDVAGLDASFAKVQAAYLRLFARCGLEVLTADAASGAMGGGDSIEFLLRTPAGEDEVARCAACHYTANAEVARAGVAPARRPAAGVDAVEVFATPGVMTIEGLAAAPYGVPPEQQLKTLVYAADAGLVLAVVRGDHQVNETKLGAALGTTSIRPATVDEIVVLLHARPGSLGAVGVTDVPVLVDVAVADGWGMVTGANRDGYHVRGVDVRRDILRGSAARVVDDLRRVTAGDACVRCGWPLEVEAALELGHIFKLGVRYSEPLGATVLDAAGTEVVLVMGSYGIGLERLLAAIVEQHHDAAGIVWPPAIAPYDVAVLQLGEEPALGELAARAAAMLAEAGLDVLLDDRAERPGVKFKDAELIGLPIRVAVGRRAHAAGAVELQSRRAADSALISVSDLPAAARAALDTITSLDR